jgi:hypothetical protein
VKPHSTSSTQYKHGQFNLIVDRNEDMRMRWRRMKIVTCLVILEKCIRIFRDDNKSPLTLVREILLEYKN